MNWEAISAISAAIGAIAIVVTLIYLAIQIRQNTASVKAEAYQAWVSTNVDLAIAVTNPDFSRALRRGIRDSAQLTEDTEAAFGMWNHSAFQMMQAIDTLYQMGVIEAPLWRGLPVAISLYPARGRRGQRLRMADLTTDDSWTFDQG